MILMKMVMMVAMRLLITHVAIVTTMVTTTIAMMVTMGKTKPHRRIRGWSKPVRGAKMPSKDSQTATTERQVIQVTGF